MRRTILPALLCAMFVLPLSAHAGPASLGVILTTAPRVTAAARVALIEEATRIWDKAGVRLEWIPSSMPRPSARETLRVLAIPWPSVPSQGDTTILGELIRTEGSGAVVMLSLDEAERIVARIPGRAGTSTDQRTGIILGRAAAHELGHYLLHTSAHAARGLMRAHFDDREFADPQSGAFEIDPVVSLAAASKSE